MSAVASKLAVQRTAAEHAVCLYDFLSVLPLPLMRREKEKRE